MRSKRKAVAMMLVGGAAALLLALVLGDGRSSQAGAGAGAVGTGGAMSLAKGVVAAPRAEGGEADRKVILIQGLISQGMQLCPGDGGPSPSEITDPYSFYYWRSHVLQAIQASPVSDYIDYNDLDVDRDLLAVTYSGYCPGYESVLPVYTKGDTCVGIDAAVSSLEHIFALYPDAEFDIVGHSLGGYIASYWAAYTATASDLSRVHSIVSVDGLRGTSISDGFLDLAFGCSSFTGDNAPHPPNGPSDLYDTYHMLQDTGISAWIKAHAGTNANFVHLRCSADSCLSDGLYASMNSTDVDGVWREINVGNYAHWDIPNSPPALSEIANTVITDLIDDTDMSLPSGWQRVADPQCIRGTCLQGSPGGTDPLHVQFTGSKIWPLYGGPDAGPSGSLDGAPPIEMPSDASCTSRAYAPLWCQYEFVAPEGSHDLSLVAPDDSVRVDALEVRPNYVGETNTPTPTPGPVVGGIAELPDVAGAPGREAGAPSESSGWSAGGYAALAGGLAGAAVLVAVGGWYARRRWAR